MPFLYSVERHPVTLSTRNVIRTLTTKPLYQRERKIRASINALALAGYRTNLRHVPSGTLVTASRDVPHRQAFGCISNSIQTPSIAGHVRRLLGHISGHHISTADTPNTMAGLSILCDVCRDALYAKRQPLEQPQLFYVYQTHHLTIDSLISASAQNCLICRIVYDNVSYRVRILSAEQWIDAAATMYRIRNKEGQPGLQFVIIFLGTASDIETKFMLFPTNGMCQGPSPTLGYNRLNSC